VFFCVQVPWEEKTGFERFWRHVRLEFMKRKFWSIAADSGAPAQAVARRLAVQDWQSFLYLLRRTHDCRTSIQKNRNYWGSIGLNPAASTAKNITQCARGLLAGTGELELLGVRKVRFWNKRVCVLFKYEKQLPNAYVFGDRTQQTRMCLLR